MSWLRDVDRWFIGSVLPHARAFRAKAAMLCGPAEAEDLVQEAYARVLGVADHRAIYDPKAFVLTVVRNLAMERLRRAHVVRIDHFASLEALNIADAAPDAFAIAAGRSDAERIDRILATLPPQCGRVLRMRKIDGRSPHEIAESLSISVSTVEKHIAKGLALLTRALRDDDRQAEEYASSPSRSTSRDRI